MRMTTEEAFVKTLQLHGIAHHQIASGIGNSERRANGRSRRGVRSRRIGLRQRS